jgi:lipid II:glycine glycyltransferase (peptidoglycan interpeptide bridge formation enzyme)
LRFLNNSIIERMRSEKWGDKKLVGKFLVSFESADLSICKGAVSFLQSDLWGRFKARFGWKALAFNALWAAVPETAATQRETAPGQKPLLVLQRRLGPGISFAYVPWGPELPSCYDAESSNKAAAELALALRQFLSKDTAFTRFDFPWYSAELLSAGRADKSSVAAAGSCFPRRPFVRAAADVQPPDTVLVDLTAEEGAILGNMKPKWRYNAGLAEKKGVEIRLACSSRNFPESPGILQNELERYYSIYNETAERDGILIHGLEYYAALFEETSGTSGVDLRLYMASHEGEDLAGIITLFRGSEAVYLYGASANRKRNLMAPNALQWRAMRDAKAAGCGVYDLFGIPPHDDPNHPMAGLYRFKTGFGGRIIHRPGSWDYSYRPLAKGLYSAAERTRKKLWDLKKKLKRR